MIKTKYLLVTVIILVEFFQLAVGRNTHTAHAELDPRVKAISTLALYGTVGGALLGTATMAYGTSSRAIFRGASIGLYAGLLFGSYVAISHHYQQKDNRPSETYPVENFGPYQEDGESGGMDYSDSVEKRWRSQGPFLENEENQLNSQRNQFFEGLLRKNRGKKQSMPIFIPLFSYQF